MIDLFEEKFSLNLCFIFVVFSLLTLVIPNVNAQERITPITFSIISWNKIPDEILYYREGNKVVPLEFKNGVRSIDYKLTEEEFKIFRKKEGEEVYSIIARASLPASEKALFVFLPVTGGEPKYEIFGNDDSESEFPPGSFKFVNFTEWEITVKCDQSSVDIEPEKSGVIEMKTEKGGFAYFEMFDNLGKQLAGTKLFGQPMGRELVFVSPPSKRGRTLRLKFISEVVQPGVEQEE